MRQRINVTADKFHDLYQSAHHPVIELGETTAHLVIGAVEYVTAKPEVAA